MTDGAPSKKKGAAPAAIAAKPFHYKGKHYTRKQAKAGFAGPANQAKA